MELNMDDPIFAQDSRWLAARAKKQIEVDLFSWGEAST